MTDRQAARRPPAAASAARTRVNRNHLVDAAIDLLREEGFQALTMRAVAARLGVSPIPLYTKVGDKQALVDAVAERLLGDIEVDVPAGSPWMDSAEQWAYRYRDRLKSVSDRHLLLSNLGREVMARCAQPLLGALHASGLAAEQVSQVCRMLMWLTHGFVIVESCAESAARAESDTAAPRQSGHVVGTVESDVDELFVTQLRFVIDGLRREVGPLLVEPRPSVLAEPEAAP
ncbi:TetR/AcrR family transcriptional regulator [Frankia sp. AgB1.9]|uniref:TetR/AcrR family transcriptional regulator n=1 Tax=unclassified Frankia TaxID=2632575 RepID=UPI001931EE7B|nr:MULTISPECIES: TetR family transcriptional regulator [unclassified Frankia]MBL7489418.1 TetR/AcrR family transcriptional regulator [Frankia sp. AgW1.1]MBL7550647.1 TetR/AcrR family transcriptional regulator [Frankia sp. AgB1.9]MBL7620978.1 TetR/AcrR family transcriptional regulator [Frankia sp. AgB1.8]